MVLFICTYFVVGTFIFSLRANQGLKFGVLVGFRSGIMFSDPEHNPVAKFIVSVWGDKVDFGPVRQPCARFDFIPPFRDYEFGY